MKVEARAADLIAEEMSLRDLRHAHQLTQVTIGESLGIGQDGVSRLEKRSDLLLSTLRGFVEAMGGDLQLVATFPDRPAVVLAGLTGINVEASRTPKRRPRAGAKRLPKNGRRPAGRSAQDLRA
jgi:transcriptional regulator with XRE-family HTH domain